MRAHILTDSDAGPVMLVYIYDEQGPDELVAVNAYSGKEAIKKVKEWLISIDHDPAFEGIKFKASWPVVESLVVLGGERGM